MKLYADDSKILAIVDTIVERKNLQEDIDSVSVWMREKSNFVLISSVGSIGSILFFDS